jgi:plasmid stabilization system protein ParE
LRRQIRVIKARVLPKSAAEDLFRIADYIRKENPPAAQRIARAIYESAGSLKSFPL